MQNNDATDTNIAAENILFWTSGVLVQSIKRLMAISINRVKNNIGFKFCIDTDDENNTYKNIGNKVVLDTKLCLLSIWLKKNPCNKTIM